MEFTKSAIHYCGEENRRIKVVGVCFGHQIVGRAMGNKVQKSERGWEVSVLEVPLTDEGKRIFGMEQMVSLSSRPPTYSFKELGETKFPTFSY